MDTKIDDIAEQIMKLFKADDSRVAAVVKLLGQAYNVGFERAQKLAAPQDYARTQFIRDNVGRIYVQLRAEAFAGSGLDVNHVILFRDAYSIAENMWQAGQQ